MRVVESIESTRAFRAGQHGVVGLVPTMGALHAGHASLIRRCRASCDVTWVSIFVNPIQFNEASDFDHYPRRLDEDLALCQRLGVDAVFAPTAEGMYPPGPPAAQVDVPALQQDLEAAHRPGHFAGVCRVVAKLLHLLQPDQAFFGRKDYQQLCIVRAMVADLMMTPRIVACDTVREPDGLAMSSRNQLLTPEAREHAVGLVRALQAAKTMVEDDGEVEPDRVESAMGTVMRSHHLDVEYAAVRCPRTLAPLDCIEPAVSGGVVALVAARAGGVRLLDNMVLGGPAEEIDRKPVTESRFDV